MTDLQKLIALIMPEFLMYLDNKKSSEDLKKRLDIPSNPSIACVQGGQDES